MSSATPTPQLVDVVHVDDDGQTENVISDGSSKRGSTRKLRSIVWDHFEKKIINGEQKAVCNHCNSKLVSRQNDGTKHLHDHMKSCFMKKQKDINHYMTKLNTVKDDKGHSKVESFVFDQDVTRKTIARAIVKHEYPLSIVDHEGFREILSSFNPMWKHVSQNTIKKEILDLYENEKAKNLNALASNQSRLAITTDMWTADTQTKGYMAVTGHFIDDSWTLRSLVLRFQHVKGSHTGLKLCDTLFNCLMDLHLEHKVSSVTVDNCSANDRMMEYLLIKLNKDDLILRGQLFHIRCCAHILNLIVKEGMTVISDGIAKIRESVVFWTGSCKRKEKFEEFASRSNVKYDKQLVLDCPTRWNSIYLMISSALQYKNIFLRLKDIDGQYKCCPSEEDWQFAIILEENLKSFYDVTELFSGTKYPTTNVFLQHVCEIKLSLQDWLLSPCDRIQHMAQLMLLKFDKYWQDMSGILGVACIFDPRYKKKFIEYYFSMVYGGVKELYVGKVVILCRELVEEYQLKFSPTVYCFDYTVVADELDSYLDEKVIPRMEDFNILSWWKTNANRYSTLARIARDILAIPITTVAFESAFSTGGRVVSPHRNKLHPSTLEALMCCQSLKSEGISQFATFLEEEQEEQDEQEVPEYPFYSPPMFLTRFAIYLLPTLTTWDKPGLVKTIAYIRQPTTLA
ncbi:BED-type domain-containing protein [Citrus sinensis]|uniref:BED-type domain-containing protein n=1 Tax=Citrus sinensis TaxID=2711 RepID=A0ACB8NWK7_CITSI|nr:BED-type domain-containing protein [Citrus sinensis]